MPIVSRISATFGSAMIARKRLRQSGPTTTSGACAVASRTVPAVVVTLWPSSWRARSAGSCAIRSTTCCARASLADRLTASRTARSAHSALRPRSCARPRIRGGVLHRFADLGRLGIGRQRGFAKRPHRTRPTRRGAGRHPRCRRIPAGRGAADAELHGRRRAEIGAGRHRREVAGIDDVGARARRPRRPAQRTRRPARASRGWLLMICRIDVSRPPGVPSCRIASGACWRAARSSERTMKSALAGPIAPLIGITTAGRAAAGLRWAGARRPRDEQRREQRGARPARTAGDEGGRRAWQAPATARDDESASRRPGGARPRAVRLAERPGLMLKD